MHFSESPLIPRVMTDHERGQGPPSLPTLSLHFTDLSKYLAGEKEKQKLNMRA